MKVIAHVLSFFARVLVCLFHSPLMAGFRPPSKSSLSCEVVGCDGASEGNPYRVDEVVTSSREVKMEDCLYYFM